MKRCIPVMACATGLAAAALYAALYSPPPSRDFSALDQRGYAVEGVLMHEDQPRTYLLYVPNNLPTNPVPLVMALHGGGNNALTCMEGAFERRWNALADTEQFVVTYPEGRPDPGKPQDHHWNDCRADVTDPDSLSTNDDVGFLEALIDRMIAEQNVDSNRVYATGLSNGGLMTFRLAVELRDRLAAVATVIANEPENRECALPSTNGAIPILMMMGTEDNQMPWDGGPYGCQFCNRGVAKSVAETTNLWLQACLPHPVPAVTHFPDLTTNDQSTVTRYTFTNGLDGSEVLFYRIDGGGHQVPGANPDSLGDPLLGTKNNDIVAADEIWSFFTRHSR
jgi:polyhydroxybutyrate depolymerase